jgi:3-keto-disaccharide hydrolase
MRARRWFWVGIAVMLVALTGLLTAQQPAPPSAPARAPLFNPNALAGEKDFVVGVQPTFTWFPDPPVLAVPEGFVPIFNGQNLTGWHASPDNHHGVTPDYRVIHGAIVGTQSPFGDGGILLTDKSYKNFELYMEVRPDYGCDSGIFFRSTESGHAYQITMDYLPGGSMGRLITETINGAGGTDRAAILAMRGLPPSATPAGASTGTPAAGRGGAPAGAPAAAGRAGMPPRTPVVAGIPLGMTTPNGEDPWMKVWKREAWNTVRVRVEGDIPHVTVWINDQVVTDTQEKTNRAEGGVISGPIAIQIHGGNRWVQAGFWRWRNIGIKELP